MVAREVNRRGVRSSLGNTPPWWPPSPAGPILDGFANSLLGQAEAVSVCSIDPVDTGLQRLEDGGGGVSLGPHPMPQSSPIAQVPNPRVLSEICVTEPTCLHGAEGAGILDAARWP